MISLVRLRNTLAHGKLVYDPRTRQLKIWNQRTSEIVPVTEAERDKLDKMVIAVADFNEAKLKEQEGLPKA